MSFNPSNAIATARDLLEEHQVNRLPVRVTEIATRLEVPVLPKRGLGAGVSGALVKIGNGFSIAYATHVKGDGFRRFSIGHELGHLCLAGHADALLPHGVSRHLSKAGYQSHDQFEREADCFAAHLLMPKRLFSSAMLRADDGLDGIQGLADSCETSLVATAIRYVEEASDPVGIVVSQDDRVRYAFISNELKAFRGVRGPRAGSRLPDVPTAFFNKSPENVSQRRREDHETPMSDWFEGARSVTLCEQILGLGSYGRTLTVLTCDTFADDDDEEDLEEQWTPRFRR